MELVKKQKNAQKEMRKVISEAWQDESFKQNLLKNPEGTLEKFLGKPLNKHKRIVVVDQSNPEVTYINIPEKPNFEDVELNDEQLEIVSGGTDDPGFWDFCGAYGILGPGAYVAYQILK